jgi:hypothetical protein
MRSDSVAQLPGTTDLVEYPSESGEGYKRPKLSMMQGDLETQGMLFAGRQRRMEERSAYFPMLQWPTQRAQQVLDPSFLDRVCDELVQDLESADLERQYEIEAIKQQQEPMKKIHDMVQFLLEYSRSLSDERRREQAALESLREEVYANFEREVSAQVQPLTAELQRHTRQLMAKLNRSFAGCRRETLPIDHICGSGGRGCSC